MTEEILDLIVGDPASNLAGLEEKTNTCPLGCDPDSPGIFAAIIALAIGGFLAFFTDFFSIIADFFTSLF